MFKMKQGMLGLLAGLVFLVGCGIQTSVPAPQPEPSPEPPRRDTTARDKKLREHHDTCVDLFGKTAGSGFERMVIIRHEPGSYPASVELPSTESQSDTPAKQLWGMTRHELIGLMTPADVGAYPTNTLSHRLEKPKKRPLDAFEGHALTKLRGGEELVIEETGEGHLRVVGAVRLKMECMRCHQSEAKKDDQAVPAMQVGYLMGAFSYEFRRGVAGLKPQPGEAPLTMIPGNVVPPPGSNPPKQEVKPSDR